MSIKINNLHFKYSKAERLILDGINLSINDGDIVILLGNNGCGKTTLIKCIVGLLNKYSGDIQVNGTNIKDYSYKERSKEIAYVSQSINSLDDIIVKDFLTFGFVNDLKFYERPSNEQIETVKAYAEKFNISHLLDKKINEISGGERQIVAICSALIQNSKIIILDEPTSALDLRNQNNVLTILRDIAKTENKTLILSSHNPNHASFLGSKVALMNAGKIVDYGDAREIISIDKLKPIYGDNICYSSELEYNEISFK